VGQVERGMGRRAHPPKRYVIFYITPALALTTILYGRTCTLTTKTTCDRCVFVFVIFPHRLTHAEHEKTPMLVSFRARNLFYTQQRTPNTRRHHRWCPSVLGVFSTPSNARRTREDTNEGVLLCSACFLHPLLHAEHERTPLLVSFRSRRVFYTQQRTPNMRGHHGWCPFMLGVFSTFTDAHRT